MELAKKSSIIRSYSITSTEQSFNQRETFLIKFFSKLLTASDASHLVKRLLLKMRSPNEQKQILLKTLTHAAWVHVSGTLENRIVFLGLTAKSGIMISLGSHLKDILKDACVDFKRLEVSDTPYLAEFEVSPEQKKNLIKPLSFLISLYHPENFPLPRFALGISDLARAIRKYFLGEVHLFDMQLGIGINDILLKVIQERPDVIGISATFGQYDLLETFLELLTTNLDYNPLILVGGSLGALNRDQLLNRNDVDFVSVGAGEKSIQDIIFHWHGTLAKNEISDVAYFDSSTRCVQINKRINNRHYDDIMPELDLLDETLNLGGVFQLESSRGCSYACSFCPREHKGIWAGEDAAVLDLLLPEIANAFNKHPAIDKRIFLVDEEFVGYQDEEVVQKRCQGFAKRLFHYKFKFETSSRIDQVVRRNRNKDWHIERMRFWKSLKQNGLSRCLFGVESGSDSILVRFNKKTTKNQNIQGIRTLTAMNIPIRCTYITFDPLMSFDELKETVEFLGRKDLILCDLSAEDEEHVFDGLDNKVFIERYSKNIPFYHLVSYMLVSMEALTGSDYLTQVEDAGLTLGHNSLMGRKEVVYRDPRIGKLSSISQQWVDRNFSLDYTLKSLEKIVPTEYQYIVRRCRVVLKEAAYNFLVDGTYLIEKCSSLLMDTLDEEFLENNFSMLKARLTPYLLETIKKLPDDIANRLQAEMERWSSKHGWTLINGVCE